MLLDLSQVGAIAVFSIAGIAIFLVLLRWINGWLFRLNDILKNLRDIITELRKLNNKKE